MDPRLRSIQNLPRKYLETWQGGTAGNPANNPSIVQVNNNTLAKIGAGMGMGGLDYNFIGSPVLSAGGFSLSFDVVNAGSNTDDLADRYGGFGIGLSLAELNAFQDENDTAFGPRGSISTPGTFPGVADFYVSLSLENKVQVFTGGTLAGQFAVPPTGSRTIKTDFRFADFNAGSLVSYTVSFENNEVASGSFNWSGTDQNYIGFSMRANTVNMDNLAITAVPEPSSIALALAGAAGLFLFRRKSAR